MRGLRCAAVVALTLAGLAGACLFPFDRARLRDDRDATSAIASDARGGATTAGWCAGRDAALCEDFDDGRELPGTQGLETTLVQGTLVRESLDDAPSLPHALVASGQVGAVQFFARAELGRKLDVTADEVHLEHDVRLEGDLGVSDVLLSWFHYHDGEHGHEVLLEATSGGFAIRQCYDFADAGSECRRETEAPRRATGWTRVRIDLVKSRMILRLSLDGVLVFSGAPVASVALAQGKLSSLHVGVHGMYSREPIRAAFDNVVLSYE
jgi:hypothetical protein